MDDRRWETEALRAGRSRQGGRPTVSQDRRPVSTEPAIWVTLKEASDATGIPVGTLGSWARRGTVDSYVEGNGGRKLRIVDLNAVRGRAHDLGRPVAPVPIRVVETPADAPSATEQRSAASPPHRGGDEEMMIVPLDAWNKMLNQLGNLHEAGQQLADARERAAKAETEASFLRERLAELRVGSPPPSREVAAAAAAEGGGYSETNEPSSPPAAGLPPKGGETETEPWMPTPVEPEPVAEATATSATARIWQYLSDGWKSRRR